jgi:hypothetical protein
MIDFNVSAPLPKGKSSQIGKARFHVRSYPASPASLPPGHPIGAVRGQGVICPGFAVRPTIPVIQPQVIPAVDPLAQAYHPTPARCSPVHQRRTPFHTHVPSAIPKPRQDVFDLENARLELRRIEKRKEKPSLNIPEIWLDQSFMTPV